MPFLTPTGWRLLPVGVGTQAPSPCAAYLYVLTGHILHHGRKQVGGVLSPGDHLRGAGWGGGVAVGGEGRRPTLIRRRSIGSQEGLLFDPSRRPGRPLPPLTATIVFMASSLRESLLVSSISFRSSCLGVGKAQGVSGGYEGGAGVSTGRIQAERRDTGRGLGVRRNAGQPVVWVELGPPQKRYIEVLTARTPECDPIWK